MAASRRGARRSGTKAMLSMRVRSRGLALPFFLEHLKSRKNVGQGKRKATFSFLVENKVLVKLEDELTKAEKKLKGGDEGE